MMSTALQSTENRVESFLHSVFSSFAEVWKLCCANLPDLSFPKCSSRHWMRARWLPERLCHIFPVFQSPVGPWPPKSWLSAGVDPHPPHPFEQV